MLRKIYRLLNVTHVTLAIIGGQIFAYLMVMSRKLDPSLLDMRAHEFLNGEYWRVITFVILPPVSHPLWACFAWYIFYLLGNSLEQIWGSGKYNLYLLSGCLISIMVAFLLLLYPGGVSSVSNVFLTTTVFLAFAFYNPNFVFYIFLILPVKVKWLALIMWLIFGYILIAGSVSERLIVLASVGNFFLFLGVDVWRKIRGGQRKMSQQVQSIKQASSAFHTCVTCGITDKTHPDMTFRYCSTCAGSPGYCTEHMDSHEHITEDI